LGDVQRGVLSRDYVLAIRHTLAGDSAGHSETTRQIAVAYNTKKLVPADRHFILP
jgi:hypothetical protein